MKTLLFLVTAIAFSSCSLITAPVSVAATATKAAINTTGAVVGAVTPGGSDSE